MTQAGDSTSTRVLVDLNILPDRHRRGKINPIMILAFLFWAVLLGLLYPAGINFLQAQSDYTIIHGEFSQLKTEVDNYQSVDNRLETIQAEIENTHQQAEEIKSKYNAIKLNYASWSSLLFSIVESFPPGVEIQEINQSGTQVELEGSAASYDRVLILRDDLIGLGSFPIVQIKSIQFLTEQEFPAGEETPVEISEDFPYLFRITLNTQEEGSQP
ncbi:MAG: PilN domain-containing protein [Anaerolineales bacterium]|nr:PilN domain-containing protein [Anaerolineales bacterium]MDZ7844604.1 PilN domain-containing protein [Anaerolineales bacterium]